MKKLSQKIGSNEPRKLQILVVLRPWGVAPNPTRDESLDPLAGSARTRPRRMAGKGRSRPLFCWTGLSVSLLSIDFRGISSQAARPPAAVFHGSIDNSSAPSVQYRFSAYSGWSAARGR